MSAVILAVIVIMWAVVLVPMWLRRHDAATESRSVDRFSTAMRVLSRRGSGGPDRRYVLMPRRDTKASVHVSGASAPQHRSSTRPAPAAPPSRPQSRPQKRRQPRASLAVRRRRTLLALAGVTFLTFVLSFAGVIGWPLQFVVDLILAVFVVHLRTQAKRAAAVSRQRRRAAVAPVVATTAPARASAMPTVAAPTVAGSAAPAPAAAVERPAVEADTEPMPAVQTAATGTDDAWQPVPVPPPTYTMKPKAPQRWTYTPPAQPGEPGHLVAESAPPAEESYEAETYEPAPAAEASELDGILEHRWAVND